MIERRNRFDCFGGTVELSVTCAPVQEAGAETLLDACRRQLLAIHDRLTRFDPGSELCRMNADPREAVPASAIMRRLAAAVPWAGRLSGGLVDGTCLPAVEAAGYRRSLSDEGPRPPEAASPVPGAWDRVRVDRATRSVVRPAGVRLDSGGLAKGMAADLIGRALRPYPGWAVACGGEVRAGGRPRPLEVTDPWGGEPVHRTTIHSGAAATSGVTTRRWMGGHHLIDPRTGAPADTGLAQVTAFAPTALEAEVLAKSALLSGPDGANGHLRHGGVVVAADGGVRVVQA